LVLLTRTIEKEEIRANRRTPANQEILIDAAPGTALL
jgi:hypothetical protein